MTDEKGKTTTITGIVAASNDRGKGGVKLQGEDEWRNVSKFTDGVVIPAKGTHVILTLDSSGYIRSIAPAPKDSATPEAPQPRQDSATGAKTDWARKDALMTRMSCLRGACEIVASYEPSMSESDELVTRRALKMAADFERWVNREDDSTAGRDVPDWADWGSADLSSERSELESVSPQPEPPAQPQPTAVRPSAATLQRWAQLVHEARELGIEVEPIKNTDSAAHVQGRGLALREQVKKARAVSGAG